MRGMDTGDLTAGGRRGAAAEGMQAPLADSACSERDNKDAKTGRVYEPHSWAKRAAGQGARACVLRRCRGSADSAGALAVVGIAAGQAVALGAQRARNIRPLQRRRRLCR